MELPSTPATSIAHSVQTPASPVQSNTPAPADAKLLVQVQEQASKLDEQDVMIKTLNKQLTHCEHDLQAHIDMVNTLETSLAESEKNCKCSPSCTLYRRIDQFRSA